MRSSKVPCENLHAEIIVSFAFPHILRLSVHICINRMEESISIPSLAYDILIHIRRVAMPIPSIQFAHKRTKPKTENVKEHEDNDLIISHIDTFINTMGTTYAPPKYRNDVNGIN